MGGGHAEGVADQGAVVAEFAVGVAVRDIVPEAAGPPERVQLGVAVGGVAGGTGAGAGAGAGAVGEAAGQGGGDGVGVAAGA